MIYSSTDCDFSFGGFCLHYLSPSFTLQILFFFEGVGEAPKLMIFCKLRVRTVEPILHFARVKIIYEVYYHEGVTGAAVNRCEREMCDGRYGHK